MKLIGFFLAAFLFTGTAHAQNQTGLTKENVEAFMEEGAAIYKKPYAEFTAFMDKATHDDYQGNLITTIHNGKNPPAQMPVKIDKKIIMNGARDSYDSAQGATITLSIEDIQMAPDNKTATVKSTLTIINQKLAAGESGKTLLSDMKSTCTDEIIYTATAETQVLKSNCKVDMTIKQEQGL